MITCCLHSSANASDVVNKANDVRMQLGWFRRQTKVSGKDARLQNIAINL